MVARCNGSTTADIKKIDCRFGLLYLIVYIVGCGAPLLASVEEADFAV